MLARIEHHREARDDQRERRALVSTLIRSFNIPPPAPEIANIVSALGKTGIFRSRTVLMGTVAYQTYPAMLGIRLPRASMRTGDIDIAQFSDVSIAIEDRTPPLIEILKKADATFRAVPSVATAGERRATGPGTAFAWTFLRPTWVPTTTARQLCQRCRPTHSRYGSSTT